MRKVKKVRKNNKNLIFNTTCTEKNNTYMTFRNLKI